MGPARALGFSTLLAAVGPAQCAVQGLVATTYGTSCGISGPQLQASFWAPTCHVVIHLQQPLLWNSATAGGWLAFGLSPQQTVHPPLGPCPLLANPVAIAPVIGALGISVPPGLPPFTFWVHGLANYVNTLNNTYFVVPSVTGLQVALQ
jgi:hypothetical protein